ncbi:transposase [Azospirillum oryzae]|nr:transposase [Azospirillum oryzae]
MATCPTCGTGSDHVHSHYWRTIADLPWQGRQIVLRVQVRRFRCRHCGSHIFAERQPEIARKERRTGRLALAQAQIGLVLGGEPGARLVSKLAMPVSGDTILRLIRKLPPPPCPPPRVIGVDDWAWRRSRRYGTIVCDLERGRVIDLLPDRSAAPLRAWLKRHPTVALVSRDRSGPYAEAIRTGAPGAVQVADRWHLLVNASDALRSFLDRHHAELREAARLCGSGVRPSACAFPPDAMKLDRYTSFAEAAWRSGRRNVAAIWRALVEQGFEGGYDIVRRWVKRRRMAESERPDAPLPSWRVPSSRRAARLLTSDPTTLSRADRRFVDTVRAIAPSIREVADLINDLGKLLRRQSARSLAAWLEAASATALRNFAQGLAADLDALQAALQEPWNNSPVEGQINRLKLIKRQMFGRAKFDLLRQRVLCTA